MIINTLTLESTDFPPRLTDIAAPPRTLFHSGAPLKELLNRPRVAIVGSRNVSTYGKQVTTQVARELAEQGVVIISGLALGVDALAHTAALEAGGFTVAVLPGPLQKIYPATHAQLAERILKQGGALISEYEADTPGFKQNFIARNRLIAGLAQAVLITEAGEKSGSLHTARFARRQGREVLAVPGNITSPGSAGTNSLLKSGATLVTSSHDVLEALGLKAHHTPVADAHSDNPDEQALLKLLLRGIHDGQHLLTGSALGISEFNQALTRLEISGKIRSLGGNQWALS